MRRRRASVTAPILATVLAGSGATVAFAVEDATTNVHLCDLVEVEELRALSGLPFEPVRGQATMCNVLSPDGDGSHSVMVTTRPGVLDDVRQAETVALALGDVPAVGLSVDEHGAVYAQLDGDRLLAVNVTAGSEGSSGLTPMELGLSVAERVVENMRSVVGADAAPAGTGPSLAPPDVDGLDMDALRFDGDGLTMEEEQPDMASALAPLLDAFGADAAAMTVYQSDSGGQSTAPGYQAYIAVRIDGAGGGELGPAFLSALGLTDLPGIETAEAEVGGRSVTALTLADQPDLTVYLYDAGDTVYLIQMEEALAARLLEALP